MWDSTREYLSPGWWLSLAQKYTQSRSIRNYRAMFGLSPTITSQIWDEFLRHRSAEKGIKPVHFLWTLCFLKTYTTQDVLYSRFCGSRTTYSEKVWSVIQLICESLPEVGFQNV